MFKNLTHGKIRSSMVCSAQIDWWPKITQNSTMHGRNSYQLMERRRAYDPEIKHQSAEWQHFWLDILLKISCVFITPKMKKNLHFFNIQKNNEWNSCKYTFSKMKDGNRQIPLNNKWSITLQKLLLLLNLWLYRLIDKLPNFTGNKVLLTLNREYSFIQISFYYIQA